jgi:hypothetical protein
MVSFHYQCPVTGFQVQGWKEDKLNDRINRDTSYETVTCIACGGQHLVNLKTAKLIGQRSEPENKN